MNDICIDLAQKLLHGSCDHVASLADDLELWLRDIKSKENIYTELTVSFTGALLD